ncbi:MAG: hypothetical protein KKE76_15895 [Gammaproteobacteria bacterium]|nr:hypothetical protein [Gammaproteobacteria bacterium]
MHTYSLSSYARIVIVATAAVVLSACAHAPAHYQPAPSYESRATYYDYRYYPEADCYYDTRARVYIYYEQDHWVRARSLPSRMRPHLGRHVDIRSPHDRPYEDRRRHPEQYAPDRHRSEHYNNMTPGDRRSISQPQTEHRDKPSHGRYDSRKETKTRDRDSKEQARERSPAQRHYSESTQRGQRPAAKTSPAHAEHSAERREPPLASAAIVKKEELRHERSNRNVEPRFPCCRQ